MKKAILLSILFFITLSAQSNEYNLLNLEHGIKASVQQESSYTGFSNPQERSKKNAGLAILYSLLLPGMGELYAGDYSTGKYFTIAEAVLWGSYIGIDTYGNWLQNRYISYANSTGGASKDGKDEDYYAIIGEYRNIEQYNNDQALDRNFEEMYDEETHYWKWNTEQDRRSYRNMWVSSEQAYNSLRFIGGALIVNRIISAINAVRTAAAYNRNLNTETSWNVSVGVISHPGIPTGLSLHFNRAF